MGAPMIKVELTKEHLCDAIETAIRWFTAKKGVTKLATIGVNCGRTTYDLPDDVDTVTDVVFTSGFTDISLEPYMWADVHVPYGYGYGAGGGTATSGTYSTLTQVMQYNEMAKRILGAEPDWRQEGRMLFIFPIPASARGVMIEYKSNCVDVQQLNERDHDLVKRYALMWVKQLVGRVRSKYESLPSAQGSVTMDGAALLDESRTEKELLEEEISQSAYPMHFFTG